MKHWLTTALAAALCAGLCAEEPPAMLEITGFVDGSAMQAAGAQVGDIILKYDGHPCPSLDALGELKQKANGDTPVLLLRGDEQVAITIPAGQLGVHIRSVMPDHEIASDAVRIEGIGRLGWDMGMENTFHACMYRLDERFGRGLSYADMVGLSGYAFRFHVFSASLCPSSPDAACGYDTGARILDVLGYDSEVYFLEDAQIDEAPDSRNLSQTDLESVIYGGLDAGWPSIAIDLIETPEWGIITGYQREGEEMFCRTFFDHTRDYELAEKFPWAVYAISGYDEKSLDNAYRASLVTARELLTTETYEGYHSGFAGYDRWIEHLKAIDGETGEDALADAMHANWWMYVSLSSARYFAVQYLRANVDKFGLPVADIESLADIYQQQHELLNAGYDNVPGVMTGAEPADWTPELRAGQIETIGEMKKLEKQALEILDKA